MAEVTSSKLTTSTQCSPPTKKARMEEEDTAEDALKPVGSLTFLIRNFREFSERPPADRTTSSMRHCDAKVSVRGLTFGMAVYPARASNTKQSMGIIVKCENTNGCKVRGVGSWSCLAFMTFRVKPLPKGRGYQFTHRFFSSKKKASLEWKDTDTWYFDYLMDPKNGFYNEKDDTVELIAEISADPPVGVIQFPRTDAIQVNEEMVFVNKNQLALHSRYFRSLFYNGQFDEGQTGVYKVQIEAPGTVEYFKRMMDTLPQMNKPLSDHCIAGVLHLANQFLVADVEGKCVEFLRGKSKKPVVFKYRMADKYGYIALKKHLLDNLEVMDFKDNEFFDNLAEFNQLGPEAAMALHGSYNETFSPNLEPDSVGTSDSDPE